VKIAGALPVPVGAALLASAEGYTPRSNQTLDHAREELGSIQEIATALAECLPAPKAPARKSRRRRRKRKSAEAPAAQDGQPSAEPSGEPEATGAEAPPESV
jgi:hypothetical protein